MGHYKGTGTHRRSLGGQGGVLSGHCVLEMCTLVGIGFSFETSPSLASVTQLLNILLPRSLATPSQSLIFLPYF